MGSNRMFESRIPVNQSSQETKGAADLTKSLIIAILKQDPKCQLWQRLCGDEDALAKQKYIYDLITPSAQNNTNAKKVEDRRKELIDLYQQGALGFESLISLNRFIYTSNDDNASVCKVKINEAINAYNKERGFFRKYMPFIASRTQFVDDLSLLVKSSVNTDIKVCDIELLVAMRDQRNSRFRKKGMPYTGQALLSGTRSVAFQPSATESVILKLRDLIQPAKEAIKSIKKIF